MLGTNIRNNEVVSEVLTPQFRPCRTERYRGSSATFAQIQSYLSSENKVDNLSTDWLLAETK